MMKMTESLANNLMNCLAALAISANGGCPIDENEEIIPLAEEQRVLIEKCARTAFEEICSAWEETMDDTWEIIPDGENACLDFCEDYASENILSKSQ